MRTTPNDIRKQTNYADNILEQITSLIWLYFSRILKSGKNFKNTRNNTKDFEVEFMQ